MGTMVYQYITPEYRDINKMKVICFSIAMLVFWINHNFSFAQDTKPAGLQDTKENRISYLTSNCGKNPNQKVLIESELGYSSSFEMQQKQFLGLKGCAENIRIVSDSLESVSRT